MLAALLLYRCVLCLNENNDIHNLNFLLFTDMDVVDIPLALLDSYPNSQVRKYNLYMYMYINRRTEEDKKLQ